MSELDPSAVEAAARRLAGIANRTPVITSRTLNAATGRDLFFKCENFQRVGAFKFRGAYNAISQLSDEERAAGVITHSSGNHAQGVALAARLQGVEATVVMPEDAPAIKRAATMAYGAQIVSCKAVEREEVTAHLISEHGYTLIHPYDNTDIIAGQGTSAWELFEEVGPLDLLFVPVGGGGLISGCALAAAGKSRACKVIGVEPELGNDANRSWREGKIVTLDHVPNTIADGLRTRHVGEHNLAIMRHYVADMTTVSDEDILEAMRFLWQRMKIIVEPSAAAALAPLYSGRYHGPGQRVGVLLSGGNVDVFNFRPVRPVEAPTRQTFKLPSAPVLDQPSKPRVLVCDALDESTLAMLRRVAEVEIRAGLGPDELQTIIGTYDGLIVGEDTRVTGQVIEYGYRLRVVGSIGDSLDNIDVSTARALGVEVCFAPTSSAVAVAEYTIGLLLALANQSPEPEAPTQQDNRLAGKTLGLVGFGRVGRQVAQRARAFDMRVLVNQPRLTPELALAEGLELADLSELLRESDYVSLHVPYKTETETLIGRQELAMMKPTAYLINTAHTELVDDDALFDALENHSLAGAALGTYQPRSQDSQVRPSERLRHHRRVRNVRHVINFKEHPPRAAVVDVVRQVVEFLQTKRARETLSLDILPVDQVIPHEAVDDKRVATLMQRLERDGRLVNPPVVVPWGSGYVILDGATRFAALKRMGFSYIIAQVVSPSHRRFALHTWYHVVRGEISLDALLKIVDQIPGVVLRPLTSGDIQDAFQEPGALCYLLARQGRATLILAEPELEKLSVLNAVVDGYTRWATVERTLLTDMDRLEAQFPDIIAVVIFPQFSPETVFDIAGGGGQMPAGLTRFVVPGRVLRLNADLERLKSSEPLPAKRAWLNGFLEEKLARSRLRYYQEPVILLEE